jgi:hypothetical protein
MFLVISGFRNLLEYFSGFSVGFVSLSRFLSVFPFSVYIFYFIFIFIFSFSFSILNKFSKFNFFSNFNRSEFEQF